MDGASALFQPGAVGIGQVFAGLATEMAGVQSVLSAQGVAQMVPVFEGEPTGFLDWVMAIEKKLKKRKLEKAEEQRQNLEQDKKVQEQEPIDDTMGEDDDPMGEDSFDDAMSVNEGNGCTPTDTESKKVNCPEKTETLNRPNENKLDPKI